METVDLTKLSSKELAELLKQKKEEERQQSLLNRDAYEAIRAELVQRFEQKTTVLGEEVAGFHQFCVGELSAFRQTMADYGQLRRETQMSFTIQEGNFKIEVKSNKVKKFDERADVAASRLIDFLQTWIQGKEDGADNPMYQLAMTLLERNKNGDLDYKSISKLYDLEARFDDPEYTAIMALFKESHLVDGTATNFYFYKRDQLGVWRKQEISFNRL